MQQDLGFFHANRPRKFLECLRPYLIARFFLQGLEDLPRPSECCDNFEVYCSLLMNVLSPIRFESVIPPSYSQTFQTKA